MNKKLIAVAVAGALGAPGLALAQASTVSIYGTISVGPEYRSATGADATSSAPSAGASSVRAGAGGVTAAGAALVTPGFGVTAAGVPLTVGPQPGLGTTAAYPFVANNLGGTYSSNPANQDWRTSTSGPGSNIGFRGREDLGRGMYAGFQIEYGIHSGGDTQWNSGSTGNLIGSRNTGLWLGNSAWGEIGVGLWDTPFAQNISVTGPGSAWGNSSTNMSAGLLAGLSIAQQTYSGYGIGSYCAANNGATPAGCFGAMTSFQRRQENSVFYRSPNWGGVSVKAVYAVNQPYTTSVTGSIATAQQGATAVSSGAALKPSVWGVSVTYDNGGFHGGLGYETHNNHTALGMKTIAAYMTTPVITLGSNNLTAATAGAFGAQLATFNTAAMTSSSDWGLNLNLRYNMANGFGVGAYWERLDYSWAYNAVSATSSSDVRDLSRDAYRLDATYRTGPHTVGITYGHANDIKGNTGALGFNGSGTATTEWMLDYAYSFSKRTSIFAYYNQMKNDTNARASGIVFNGITAAPGADPKYIGAGMKHTF